MRSVEGCGERSVVRRGSSAARFQTPGLCGGTLLRARVQPSPPMWPAALALLRPLGAHLPVLRPPQPTPHPHPTTTTHHPSTHPTLDPQAAAAKVGKKARVLIRINPDVDPQVSDRCCAELPAPLLCPRDLPVVPISGASLRRTRRCCPSSRVPTARRAPSYARITARRQCHASPSLDVPAPAPQVHPYVSTGLAGSKFGIRNTHLQVRQRVMARTAAWAGLAHA